MNNIYIYRDDNLEYPSNEKCAFSPSKEYPEYPFSDFAVADNGIYRAVRALLYECGYDKENYETSLWNPFKEIISLGDTVLIKPNMVKHINETIENGTDCLYTNPSLVRAVIDYVVLALKGSGRIILADAPVQSSDFEEFIRTSGYKQLLNFYERQGIKIEFYDLRRDIGRFVNGLVMREKNKGTYRSVNVELGIDSAFEDLSKEQIRKLRVTNYDPYVMNAHHSREKHEYSISYAVLEADIIINMPKIKTHRLAGMTGALKNMVGINSQKDYLPHHRVGAPNCGGDEYEHDGLLGRAINVFTDLENHAIEIEKFSEAKLYSVFRRGVGKLYRKLNPGKATIGNWYGNDTIWRMVNDLNRIVLYADKNGVLCDQKQRKMFIIGDMVISGEGEGPLNPSPKKTRCIIMGEHPVAFDMVVSKLMGYDYKKLPVIRKNFMYDSKLECTIIISNEKLWNGYQVGNLDYCYRFKRPKGW